MIMIIKIPNIGIPYFETMEMLFIPDYLMVVTKRIYVNIIG